MEFILDMQAKCEERWAKADERWAKADERWAKADGRLKRMEHLVAQNNRLVTRLARAGVALRSDVRRHERAITRITENLAEATEKLNALIDVVDKWPPRSEGAR
jgi:hypothetical protein